jgi:hypothetical protein
MNNTVHTLATLNAALRFLLEITALIVFGYWGFQYGTTTVVKYGLGVGIPLVVAVIWGLFGSPKAPDPVGEPWKIVFLLLIFGAATLALVAVGQHRLVLVFGGIALCNTALLYSWGGGALNACQYTSRTTARGEFY